MLNKTYYTHVISHYHTCATIVADARREKIRLFQSPLLVEMNNITLRKYQMKCQERKRLCFELEIYLIGLPSCRC